MDPLQKRAQRMLLWGLAGMVAFLVALAALHVIDFVWPTAGAPEPGSRVLSGTEPRHISAYALGHGGPVWYAGVVCLGLGMMAFAMGLKRLLPRVRNSVASCWLLFAAGCSMLLLDVFPTDATPMPTTPWGALHDIAAISSLTLQCSAMVLLSESGSRNPAWQQVVGSSPAWSAVATVLSIGWGFMDILPAPGWEFGAVAQRAVAVFLVYWMLMVGWRARWVVQSTAATSASTPTG
ncbi:MAG: DUF998 domain-containing protein [bacterium]